MGAPSVTTASMSLAAWSLASMDDWDAGALVPSTLRFSTVPLKVFLTPAQRCSRETLPCSWMTQSAFLRPRLFSSLADRLAGHGLVLPDVGERAELLRELAAGVDRDDRDPGVLRLGEYGLHGLGLGQGDDDPVDLLVDRGLDQLGLPLGLFVVASRGTGRCPWPRPAWRRSGRCPRRCRPRRSGVTIAIFRRGVPADLPPPEPSALSSEFLPPELLHPAASATTAMRVAAVRAVRMVCHLLSSPPVCGWRSSSGGYPAPSMTLS